MRTLVIISHPTMEGSLNQQFLKEVSSGLFVTWYHLEPGYPGGKIDIKAELQLLVQYDRTIFRFPSYWYSFPARLKIWQGNVLKQATRVLEGKELGIILTIGMTEKEYQTGGKKEYTILGFLRPYQRITNKLHTTYLSPFVLAQLMYLSQEKRWKKLITYQQYLSLEGRPSFTQRVDWFIQKVQENWRMQEEDSGKQTYIIEALTDAEGQIEDLSFTPQEVKGTPL